MPAKRRTLQPVPRLSTADLTVDRIRQHIDAENLQAGDRLPGELELVQQLGVSRPVLREAMTRLESLGLVSVQRGRGTFVADRDDLGRCVQFMRSALAIAPKDLVQFAELRTLVECFAARRAAERATPTDVAELAAFCDAMDRADLDYDAAVRVDFQFHQKIVALSGNALLQNLIAIIHEYVMAGMVHTTPKPRDRSWSAPLHAAILNAIRAGDGPAAEQAMKRHMDAVVLRLTSAAEASEVRPVRRPRPQ